MKKAVFHVILILLPFILPAPASPEKTIIDDLGHPFTMSSPPQKIVSLAPNITEILFALGLGEKVIGVTRYCDYPEEALYKEKIGGMIDLNMEKIKALDPDLVLGFRGNPLKLLERIKVLGLPIFVLGMGESLESVFSIIEKIGTVVQKTEEAEILLQSLKQDFKKIEEAIDSVQHRPKVFISLHGRGLWTCGKKSFIHDLITRARGENIAGESRRRWLLYNREQLIHQDPEIIIILAKSSGEFSTAREWIKKRSHLESVQAVRNDNIHYVHENLVTRPGPRILEALNLIVRILHPQLSRPKGQ
jgi:iron complex transport system substrate-binding protein